MTASRSNDESPTNFTATLYVESLPSSTLLAITALVTTYPGTARYADSYWRLGDGSQLSGELAESFTCLGQLSPSFLSRRSATLARLTAARAKR